MQPEQPQYPGNYLDSIAVQQPVKTMNPFVLWGLIGGILALLIIVVAGVAGSATSTTQRLTTFGAQVSELKTIAEDSQENIQSGDLRSLNSSLSLTLTNTNRDLTGILEASDIKLDNKKNKEVVAAASSATELKNRLEEARLNAVFDRTYAREMAFYIKTMRSEMEIIYNKSKSSQLKGLLETTDKDFASLQDSFDSFNEG